MTHAHESSIRTDIAAEVEHQMSRRAHELLSTGALTPVEHPIAREVLAGGVAAFLRQTIAASRAGDDPEAFALLDLMPAEAAAFPSVANLGDRPPEGRAYVAVGIDATGPVCTVIRALGSDDLRREREDVRAVAASRFAEAFGSDAGLPL